MPSAARVLTFTGLTVLIACSVAELPGSGNVTFSANAADGEGSAEGGAVCISEKQRIEKVDLNTLQACQCKLGGRAHCIAEAKLPDSIAKPLANCQGTTGRCVPDSVIESGGEPFPTCKASGEEGRCVTLCVPRVEKYAEALTRGDGDSCLPDEKCVPCKMPNGTSSGICEVGTQVTCVDSGIQVDGSVYEEDASIPIPCPYNGTPMSVTQMPPCAPGGRCVSEGFLETAIPDPNTRSELLARLAKCALGYCMPEDYLKHYGQYKPPVCRSLAGIEGRCFSIVFNDIDAQKELLPRDICSTNDRCIPCFNPADGSPSGACTTVSCDQATTVPPVLDNCCFNNNEFRGKCVPRSDIPQDFQGRLTWYECDSEGELCVPTENVDLKSVPTECVPQPILPVPVPTNKGVCVSRCLVFSFLEGLAYQTASCRPDQICAPCIHPQTGQPTGAPGCKN